MSHLIRRLLNIYPGEGKKAFLFVLLAYVWAIGISSGNKFSDALFLLNIGPDFLPRAYFITACALLTAASFLLSALNWALPRDIFFSVIVINILFYIGISLSVWTGIGFDTTFFWFLFKIASYVLFIITISCFWVFIDQYYHIQDAKRLFTLFNAAIFMGDATTGVLMRSNIFVLDTLMIYILVSLTSAFILAQFISKGAQQVSDETMLEEEVSGETRSLMFLFRSALRSRFTLLLMVFNLLMQLMLVITEYNYFFTFTERFGGANSEQFSEGMGSELTLFLGKWFAAVGIFNLVVGLFIYSRLVRRFGISNLVMVTPALLLIAFSGWVVSDLLLFPLMGMIAVEGTFYTIDDSNFTLLLNAVPSKVKYKIRVIIESFFEPIGMLLSSILLTITNTHSHLLGLILSCIWLTVAFGLRSEYLNALFSNLWENAVHLGRSASRWIATLRPKIRQSAKHRLLAVLRQGEEEEQVFACEALIAFEDPKMVEKMLMYTDKMSTGAKIKFLKRIEPTPHAVDSTVLDHIRNWLHEDYSLRLKSAVNFYLAKQGLLHPEKAIADLESDEPELVGAAIVALKSSWANLSPSSAALNRTLAISRLEELLDSEDIEKKCVGIRVLGCETTQINVDMLLAYLKDPSIRIARAAAASIAQIIDKHSARYANHLISLLTWTSDSEFRLSCLDALSKIADSTLIRPLISAVVHFRAIEKRRVEEVIYKMGLRTVPALLAITKDIAMHDRSRIVSSRILGRLALPQLHVNLYEIISREIERAYFYFLHVHTLEPVAKLHGSEKSKVLRPIAQERLQSFRRTDGGLPGRVGEEVWVRSDLKGRFYAPKSFATGSLEKGSPKIDLTLLKDTLKSGYYSVMEFVIQLLGIAGSIEDSEMLYRALRSPNIKVRGDAIEAIEKTCDPKIFRLIYPLISDIPFEEKMRSMPVSPLSLTELLDRMDHSSSHADRIMSAAMKYQLKIPNWREALRRQMSTNEELFHHFAYELLET